MTIVRLLLAVLTVASIGLALQPRSTEAAYVSPAVEFGAGVFPLGNPETTDRDLDMLVAAGLSWARIAVPWRSIEASCDDCFDWTDLDRVVSAAMARGIKLIAHVDRPPAWARSGPQDNAPPTNPEDYGQFVGAMAERYGAAGIPVIEVWNEPNLSREWGDQVIDRQQAAQYAYLLKLAYKSAHEFAPDVTVISAGLAPTATADGTAQPDNVYMQWLYEEDLAFNTDGVGIICNSFGLPPGDAVLSQPASRPYAFMYFRHIEEMRQIMVANGDAGKQAWCEEFGYTSDTRPGSPYAWHAVDETTKGNYLSQGLQYAKSNYSGWLAVLTVWAFADPRWTPDNEQYWWAITEPDGTPRPAYNAIAATPK